MSLRIFASEYVCAVGPPSAGMPSSFPTEGWAMLSAILTDLGRVPGVEVVTLLSPRARVPQAGSRCRVIRTAEEEAAFRDLACSADYTLVIAPELDDLLLTRCRWVEESGGRPLGPSPAAGEFTGGKLGLSRRL